jgi:hypothetical protein
MPQLLLPVVIFVVGYFIARLVCRLVGGILRRVGFDRLAERGGIKRALSKTNYDASRLLAKLLFYALMLLFANGTGSAALAPHGPHLLPFYFCFRLGVRERAWREGALRKDHRNSSMPTARKSFTWTRAGAGPGVARAGG